MRVSPFVLLFAASVVAACGSATHRGENFTDDSSTTPPNLGKPEAPPPSNPDDDRCGGATAVLSHAPVYMLFIVDGSGSMLDPLVPGGPTGLKWQAARSALNAFIDDTGRSQGLLVRGRSLPLRRHEGRPRVPAVGRRHPLR